MPDRTLAQFLGTALQTMRESTSLLWCLEAKSKGAQLHGNVKMVGRPLISVAGNSQFILGDGVRMVSSLRANPLGCFQPCVLRTLTEKARLVLGKNVGISGVTICAGLSIELGEGTIVGSGAMILDNDFHSPLGEFGWANEYQKNARPIKIGRGVFIGARAIILKGVTIGDRAVIGAGTVLTKDVPAGQIAFGNPARVISSSRFFDETSRREHLG